jgi:hypothetical protein
MRCRRSGSNWSVAARALRERILTRRDWRKEGKLALQRERMGRSVIGDKG